MLCDLLPWAAQVAHPLGVEGWSLQALGERAGCTFVLRTTHTRLELKVGAGQ